MLRAFKIFFVGLLIFSILDIGHVVHSEGESAEGAASASASAGTEDSLDDETTVESDEKAQTSSVASDSDHVSKRKEGGGKPPNGSTKKSETTSTNGNVLVADSSIAEEEEGKDAGPQKSPDADAIIMFTKPALGARSSGVGMDLPAGQLVNILVGFTNKGKKEFVIDAMDAQFRYPQDYSFYLQNFTRALFNQLVDPGRQASLAYSFVPAQQLSGRPFGLTIQLYYHDTTDNRHFVHSVFNDTVQLVELDEGFDTEAFFMYLFIVAVAFLLVFGFYHLFVTYGKKRLLKRTGGGGSARAPVEMGTGTNADVDLAWIPKEHLDRLQKRQSPRQSPRSRKAKRQENHFEEE